MPETDAVVAALATGTADNSSASTQQNQQGATGTVVATDTWGTAIPDELTEIIKAKGWKTPADAVKSYVELERFSSKAVQDMNPEERQKLFKRLGRPESPDGYELSTVVLPEGLPRSPEADKELRKIVWEMQGLPMKEQAKTLHEWAMKRAANMYLAAKQAQEKQNADQEGALKTVWGTSYEANNAQVDKLIRLGGDNFVQFMNGGPGKNPAVREGLFAISKLLTEETLVAGKPVPFDRTPATPGMVVDFSKSPELSGANRFGTR